MIDNTRSILKDATSLLKHSCGYSFNRQRHVSMVAFDENVFRGIEQFVDETIRDGLLEPNERGRLEGDIWINNEQTFSWTGNRWAQLIAPRTTRLDGMRPKEMGQ